MRLSSELSSLENKLKAISPSSCVDTDRRESTKGVYVCVWEQKRLSNMQRNLRRDEDPMIAGSRGLRIVGKKMLKQIKKKIEVLKVGKTKNWPRHVILFMCNMLIITGNRNAHTPQQSHEVVRECESEVKDAFHFERLVTITKYIRKKKPKQNKRKKSFVGRMGLGHSRSPTIGNTKQDGTLTYVRWWTEKN